MQVGVLIEEPFPMLALDEVCDMLHNSIRESITNEKLIRNQLLAKKKCSRSSSNTARGSMKHSTIGRHNFWGYREDACGMSLLLLSSLLPDYRISEKWNKQPQWITNWHMKFDRHWSYVVLVTTTKAFETSSKLCLFFSHLSYANNGLSIDTRSLIGIGPMYVLVHRVVLLTCSVWYTS